MYGGTISINSPIEISIGLSPRVRGNPANIFPSIHLLRSIPACTGEPCRCLAAVHPAKVYPRVYGGTGNGRVLRACVPGLSPRVRGNLAQCPAFQGIQRSIPACTGEPDSFLVLKWLLKVYPRVYGGTSSAISLRIARRGLSPRVRGNRRVGVVQGVAIGSIPACTGEPLFRGDRILAVKVYPRVYGGTPGLVSYSRFVEGLSPRVRGNPDIGKIRGAKVRSIPACTGEPGAEKSADAK